VIPEDGQNLLLTCNIFTEKRSQRMQWFWNISLMSHSITVLMTTLLEGLKTQVKQYLLEVYKLTGFRRNRSTLQLADFGVESS